MPCPVCDARTLLRDDAPPRTYALVLSGLGLLAVARLFDPAVLRYAPAAMDRLALAGLLLAAYGFLDIFRHGNRYCAVCGHRFRQPPPRRGPSPADRFRSEREEDGDRSPSSVRRSAAGGGRRAAGTRPLRRSEIEPLLKCLRFRDPVQRETAAATLRRLTGETFGPDAEAWQRWWDDRLAGRAGASAGSAAKPGEKGEMEGEAPEGAVEDTRKGAEDRAAERPEET